MKKLIIILSVLLTTLLLQSCATLKYKVMDSYDRFENIRTQQTRWNLLGSDGQRGHVYFDLYKTSGATPTTYFIILRYIGSSWIFIPEGESLVLLIDGKKHELSGDGSSDAREVLSGLVSEGASYEVNKKFIEKICNAKEIELKIRADYSLVRYFTKTNFERLKDFYNKNIKNDDEI